MSGRTESRQRRMTGASFLTIMDRQTACPAAFIELPSLPASWQHNQPGKLATRLVHASIMKILYPRGKSATISENSLRTRNFPTRSKVYTVSSAPKRALLSATQRGMLARLGVTLHSAPIKLAGDWGRMGRRRRGGAGPDSTGLAARKGWAWRRPAPPLTRRPGGSAT